MSAEASASSENESSEEFFDAEDVTPKSRGSSLKRQPSSEQTPKITISRPPRPESLTFEFEHDNASKKVAESNAAKTTVLPEEITRELEALSQVDDDRNSRIAKLEKLRQKGDFDSDEEDEGSGIGGRQAKPAQSVNPNPHPESAESSVEGIYLSGQVRQSHPFKVIEPEPDRRSVCSETRSSQGGGRSSVPKSIIHEPNSRADSLAKLSSQLHHSSRDDIVPPAYSWQGSRQPVPDIVSSLGHKLESEVIMGPPNRPPRRTKKKSIESLETSTTSAMTEGIEPPIRRQEYTSPIFSKNLSSNLHTSTPRFCNDHNPLPSPASTVASLTRDLEDTLTLDLQAAMRGQYVVKPQDDENSRGEASFQEFQRSILTSSSIEEEPETIAPLKTATNEDSLERQAQPQGASSSKFSNSDRKSLKSSSGGGSGGTRRSSSTIPPPLTNLPGPFLRQGCTTSAEKPS